MSMDFVQKTIDAALAEKIKNARSPQEIRDLCLEDGVNRGVFVRDPSGSTSVREDAVAPQQPAPQPAPGNDHLLRRAVTIDGVTRLLEAYSQTGLDILERGLKKELGVATIASHVR